jgi:hypothetical protein
MSTDEDISEVVEGIFHEYAHPRMMFDYDTGLSVEDNLFRINNDSVRIRESGLSAEKHEAEVLAWLSEHDQADNKAQKEEEEKTVLRRKYGSWCEKAQRDEAALCAAAMKQNGSKLSAGAKKNLETVLYRIPPPYGIYFVLRHINGLRNAQIAALENVPISIVQKRVKKAIFWVEMIVAELAER